MVPTFSWEQLSLILNPCTLGGADHTPASSGGGHLIQHGQSEHRICLAIEIGSGMGTLPREDQSETLRVKSETLVKLLGKWPFFFFFLLLELLTAILPS